MKNELKKLSILQENILINNASKDFTEFALFEIWKAFNKTVVFINENIEKDRVIKNLLFLNPECKVLYIEEPSKLYDFTSQNPLPVAEKVENICKMINQTYDFIILDYKLLTKKLPDKSFFERDIKLKTGEKFGYTNLVNNLFEFGFIRQDTVFEFGEFAVRGFIIDIGTINGFYRIEFEGETIISICIFNTETQRKDLKERKEMLEIKPIKEVVLTENIIQTLKRKCFDFELDASKFINEVHGFGRMNLSNFLPLFYENCSNIIDFLPEERVCVTNKSLKMTLEFLYENAKHLEELYLKEGKAVLPLNFNLYEIESQLEYLKPNFILSPYQA